MPLAYQIFVNIFRSHFNLLWLLKYLGTESIFVHSFLLQQHFSKKFVSLSEPEIFIFLRVEECVGRIDEKSEVCTFVKQKARFLVTTIVIVTTTRAITLRSPITFIREPSENTMLTFPFVLPCTSLSNPTSGHYLSSPMLR